MISLATLLGAIALASGSAGYLGFPAALSMGIPSFLNLKEDGPLFPQYMDPPFPSIASYYVFETKNPREVLAGKQMLLNVKGPFVYNAYIKRDNIAFSRGGETVEFDTHRQLHFQEGLSANIDEEFWLMNPVVPSVYKTVKSIVIDRIPFQRISEPIVFNAVNVLLDNFKERLFVKRTARDMLEGRKIEMLESILNLADRFGLKSLVPPGPPENIFGLVHYQNVTTDTIELFTGVGASSKRFGDVRTWKGKEKMTLWRDSCNLIDGTNGELHKPFLKVGKPITIFLSQMCRTLEIDPVGSGPITIQDGLQALEYELSNRTYLGTRSSPRNKCFCSDTRTYDCYYNGLIHMGPCLFDAPLYFSKANYMGVDKKIRDLIDESSIDFRLPDKQSFYLDQTTGAILRANLTFWAVFKVVRQPYMRDLARIQNLTYVPLFSASEAIVLPWSVTWQVRALQVMVASYKPANAGMALLGSGVLLFKFARRGSKKVGAASSAPEPALESSAVPNPTNEPNGAV